MKDVSKIYLLIHSSGIEEEERAQKLSEKSEE